MSSEIEQLIKIIKICENTFPSVSYLATVYDTLNLSFMLSSMSELDHLRVCIRFLRVYYKPNFEAEVHITVQEHRNSLPNFHSIYLHM